MYKITVPQRLTLVQEHKNQKYFSRLSHLYSLQNFELKKLAIKFDNDAPLILILWMIVVCKLPYRDPTYDSGKIRTYLVHMF